ncbi:hypothetical protein EOM39_04170 [Candidatus Gracilibacteria bacterium]|nr:hypothetical protein [Candidatus Gracilibacteria bacterium]
MKKIIYSIFGLSLLSLNSANAALNFGSNKVNPELRGTNDGADVAVQTLIKNAMLFLYLVAVIYGLWGGFQILTAGGKDDQVKKGRTVIVQALIGLVVIWLASSIVQWLVSAILGVNG